jgi:catechol 2,3-dioxygenase-like lactoylglutathione lyase family enzyme
MIDDTRLDHVAIAVETYSDALPVLVGDLAGRWVSGGLGVGFAPAQIAYANQRRVELLKPNRVDENDFLRRFLDHNGPGPHHLTFKVADLDAAVGAAEAAGLHPVNIDMTDPSWMEAFLHPKEALGVLVQLAQASGPGWQSPPSEPMPKPRAESPATLDYVAHAVTSLAEGRRLFGELLGGTEEGEGEDPGCHWLELTWPEEGRVRLLAPDSDASALWEWLGGRDGRIHHVAFSCHAPEAIPGVRRVADSLWELGPDPGMNTLIRLRPSG